MSTAKIRTMDKITRVEEVTRLVDAPENWESVLCKYTQFLPKHDRKCLVVVVLAGSGLVDPGDEWGIFGGRANRGWHLVKRLVDITPRVVESKFLDMGL